MKRPKVQESTITVELTKSELTDILWYLQTLGKKHSPLTKKLESYADTLAEQEDLVI